MPENIGGTVYVTANGKSFVVGETVTFNPGGWVQESVTSRSGRVNYTSRMMESSVEFEAHAVAGDDIRELEQLRDATVLVEWGEQQWLIRQAVHEGPKDVDALGGKTTHRFFGPAAERIDN